MSDAELLEAYSSREDEAAFGELMRRHGTMVYRACHRLLKDPHEAEDASQAVFVVLARKAGGLRRGDLAAWLYRVAHLVAAETVRKRMHRAKREESYAVEEAIQAEAFAASDVADQGLVDAALMGLPERYREAVILRYLQNHSEAEAAQRAGCAVGTLSMRASRGIERLRQRLAKRGVALSGAALAGLLTSEASAAVPETLLPSILAAVKTAVATTATTTTATSTAAMLAKGAMKAMFIAQVKTAAVLTAAAIAVGGAGAAVLKAGQAQTPAVHNRISATPIRKSTVQAQVPAATDNNGTVLRMDDFPTSGKDANGRLYVAIPKRNWDDYDKTMWSFKGNESDGMTDHYRIVLRLTPTEQRQLQALLDEAWGEADELERCFTVTSDGQSVTAELRGEEGLRLLQETELRIQTNFLRKAAGVLGAGRAEIMDWFAARTNCVVLWPAVRRPGPDTKSYRMKFSRVSNKTDERHGPRFAVETQFECARSSLPQFWHLDGPDETVTVLYKALPIKRNGADKFEKLAKEELIVKRDGKEDLPISGPDSWKILPKNQQEWAKKSLDEAYARIPPEKQGTTLEFVLPALLPWPALSARLGVPREAVLARTHAGREVCDLIWERKEVPYRADGSPLTTPLGAIDLKGDQASIYVDLSTCVHALPYSVPWRRLVEQGLESSDSATWPGPLSINTNWSAVLRLTENQNKSLADVYKRTLAAMDAACAKGLIVERASPGQATLIVSTAATAKYPEILERHRRDVLAVLDSQWKAEIIRALEDQRSSAYDFATYDTASPDKAGARAGCTAGGIEFCLGVGMLWEMEALKGRKLEVTSEGSRLKYLTMGRDGREVRREEETYQIVIKYKDQNGYSSMGGMELPPSFLAALRPAARK